jgi:hypothetical protein
LGDSNFDPRRFELSFEKIRTFIREYSELSVKETAMKDTNEPETDEISVLRRQLTLIERQELRVRQLCARGNDKY